MSMGNWCYECRDVSVPYSVKVVYLIVIKCSYNFLEQKIHLGGGSTDSDSVTVRIG